MTTYHESAVMEYSDSIEILGVVEVYEYRSKQRYPRQPVYEVEWHIEATPWKDIPRWFVRRSQFFTGPDAKVNAVRTAIRWMDDAKKASSIWAGSRMEGMSMLDALPTYWTPDEE